MAYISVLKLHPLFFKCHKILPLVYDESLSYYEVLCKCVASLNEVIESTNQLNDNVADINSRENELSDKVNELVENINNLEAEMDDFEAQINTKFDDLVIRIEAELGERFEDYDRQFNELKTETQAELKALEKELSDFMELKFPQFEAEIRALVNEQLALINQKFESLEDDLKGYIYTELQKILEEIPEHVWVLDPTTGEYEDIQSVINHFYNALRYWALTANEFDSLGMTVDELQHITVNGVPRGLTCLEWDMYAKLFINVDKDKDKVGSYLTGELVELVDNVNINNILLKESGCYECEEFDEVGGNCDSIDALNINAYRWDWFSNNDYVVA